MKIRFSIRDLLWLTLVVALAAGWWVDRSQLAWSHSQNLATADNLRSMLDKADPDRRTRSSPPAIPFKGRSPVAGYAMGIGLVATCIVILVLVWKRQIHPSILEEHRRF